MSTYTSISIVDVYRWWQTRIEAQKQLLGKSKPTTKLIKQPLSQINFFSLKRMCTSTFTDHPFLLCSIIMRWKHWLHVSNVSGSLPREFTVTVQMSKTVRERYSGASCCPKGLSRLLLPWSSSLLSADKELHAVCKCTDFTRPHRVFYCFCWFPNPHICL